jgi:glycosyltransferase involved in cell wall biosynthesis
MEDATASKRKRVLRLISRLVIGGPAHNVCHLSAGLSASNFTTWLVHGRPAGGERSFVELANTLGIKPIYLDSMRRKPGGRDVAALFAISGLIRQIRPHIVHTHTAKAGLLGRIGAQLHRSRGNWRPCLVHTFHGHVFDGYFGGFASRAVVASERMLARVTDAIIAVSESVRREIVDVYQIAPSHKVRVIPLGFDFSWVNRLDENRGWLRQRLGVGRDTILVGCVGRLVDIKNHDLCLRAFQRATQSTCWKAKLILFGDGELRNHLQALARDLGIAENIHFHGWEIDQAKIYSDLDLTCLTSRNEGTPVALIESLAAGVPVVATAVGGVCDVVCHSRDGELTSSGDMEDVAAALLHVARHGLRIDSSRSKCICARYSVKRLVLETVELYNELLREKHRNCRGS